MPFSKLFVVNIFRKSFHNAFNGSKEEALDFVVLNPKQNLGH